jgi:ABC-type dipeptide/oligopeptide/nickel transport system ATPase component
VTLLEVAGLRTEFGTDEGVVEAVNDVSFTVEEGETLGVVGESGSGKSVMALSLMGLVDRPGRITDGTIRFRGENLRTMDEEELRSLRGNDVSMVFQDTMESLDPIIRVGDQITEPLRVHHEVDGEDVDWLERSLLGNFVPRRAPWERTRGRVSARSTCCARSASRSPNSAPASIHTSSPAECNSAR